MRRERGRVVFNVEVAKKHLVHMVSSAREKSENLLVFSHPKDLSRKLFLRFLRGKVYDAKKNLIFVSAKWNYKFKIHWKVQILHSLCETTELKVLTVGIVLEFTREIYSWKFYSFPWKLFLIMRNFHFFDSYRRSLWLQSLQISHESQQQSKSSENTMTIESKHFPQFFS